MVKYKTLRNCVEKLKEVNVNKSYRREIISNISSQSDLEAKISGLQLKQAVEDILVVGVAGLYTLLGLHLADNASNDIVKCSLNFITVLPAVTSITWAVLSVENFYGAVKNCYNSYINKPNLIQ